MIAAPFPVYWLGGSFEGMPIGEATYDPSGSYSLQYGNCLEGGQGTCVPPLRIVTSPDNSFLPGGSTPSRRARIRGVDALLAQAGRTIVIATAGVVVDIYATNARAAAAAARTAVPINELGAPEAPLAPALREHRLRRNAAALAGAPAAAPARVARSSTRSERARALRRATAAGRRRGQGAPRSSCA